MRNPAVPEERWRKSSKSDGGGHCVEVAAWRTSSRSDGGGQCVEVGTAHNVVHVRDSKDKSGPVLTVGASAWAAFLDKVKANQLD